MRVIAGLFGGRVFDSPDNRRTHPMSEKARGAIFNALGDIVDLTFLDAYSGSGALAIEAVSRGAARGVAVDSDASAGETIAANLKSLGLERSIRVYRMNISSWSQNNQGEEYDLVFADPPYDNINLAAISTVASHTKPGGIFVLSWPGNSELPVLVDLQLVLQKQLGDIQLGFYRAE